MTRDRIILAIWLLCSTFFCLGCKDRDSGGSGDFGQFLSSEVVELGGKPAPLSKAKGLAGQWSVRRDEFGAAIDAEGIEFEVLTNLLTSAYGTPQHYSPANERHGPTYLYHFKQAGVSVFVSATEEGAEVTLTKPLEFQ